MGKFKRVVTASIMCVYACVGVCMRACVHLFMCAYVFLYMCTHNMLKKTAISTDNWNNLYVCLCMTAMN